MPTNWQEPTKAHGVRWQGFLMSDVRGDSSNRREAKCTYCDQNFSNGKPSLLYNHVRKGCGSIPAEKKIAYLDAVHASLTDTPVKQSNHRSPSSSSLNHSHNGSVIPQKRPSGRHTSGSSSSRGMNRLTALTKDKNEELNELLVKALISSETPFTILDDAHFQEYQNQLAQTKLKPLNVSHTIEVMMAKHEIEVLNRLQNQTSITLSLDSWTDPSGDTVYALVVQRGQQQLRQLIDIFEYSPKSHIAQNILDSLKLTMREKGLNWDQIASLVSDSNTVMLQLRGLITLEFPHIFGLSCSLHAFELIAKEILAHPSIKSIVQANKILVHFFSHSPYWSDQFNSWAPSNGLRQHGLSNAYATRWYSMAKVCLMVQEHEQVFKKVYCSSIDPERELPTIPADVQQIIEDPNHFLANQTLVKVVGPIIDSIDRLQRPSTVIGDIWPELISLHRTFTQTDLQYSSFDPFKRHCQDVLERLSRVYRSDEIYLIGFFLSPTYRQMAVSKKYTLEYLVRAILRIAKAWHFTRAEALVMNSQVQAYYNNEPAFKVQSDQLAFPSRYWSNLPITSETNVLRKLAISLFELVPNATGVESIYLVKEAISPSKSTQRMMNPGTLRMISHLKYDLQYAYPHQISRLSSIGPHDRFESQVELENFENGAFASGYDHLDCDPNPNHGHLGVDGDEVKGMGEMGWIDSLFDLNLFREIRLSQVQFDIPVPQTSSDPWDIDDVI